jgi:hypothetical protein
MRHATRDHWGARPAKSAPAAAAFTPTPGSSTAATFAPARTRASATWFADSTRASLSRACARCARHRPRHHAELQRTDRCAAYRQSARDEAHPVGLDRDGTSGPASRPTRQRPHHARLRPLGRPHRRAPEIEILAFEFATGCGRGERIDWHVAQLCTLATRVGRPLALVIRGGGRKLGELRRHFAQVSLIETDAFSRTIRRRRAYLTESGRLKWAKFPTPKGAPIDDLLAHNVALVRASYETSAKPAPRLWLPTRRTRRATHRDGEPVEPGLLRQLHLPGEARGIAPEPQGMITATKS